MIGTFTPKCRTLLAQTALGMALVFGLAAGSTVMAPDAQAAPKKPKYNFSKPFQAAAGPLEKALADAPKRPEVMAADEKVKAADALLSAARGRAAREQANTALEAALAELSGTLTNEKTMLEAAFAAVGNEDDRFMAGNLSLTLGGIAKDTGLQRRGLQAMIQSGRAAPADVPKFNFYIGRFSYGLKDYETAISALQAAIGAGYVENNAEMVLVESLNAAQRPADAITALNTAIARVKATGAKPPEQWYTRGFQMAYKAKLKDQVVALSAQAAQEYPTPFNWLGAFQLAREMSTYTAQEDLDHGRLLRRSGGMAYEPRQNTREYVAFLQAATERRMWPEVTAWVNEGLANGALEKTDPFVIEARGLATAGVVADARDVTGMMRDAAGAANGLTAMGAGDKLLSAGDAAKAEGYFQIALSKPGVDRDRALTRLGIAQFDQGKFAEAKASFTQVQGVRAGMGKLGAILCDQKLAPAPAAVAPAQ